MLIVSLIAQPEKEIPEIEDGDDGATDVIYKQRDQCAKSIILFEE